MAITLEQLKVGMDDKVAQQVVETFQRESEILQLIPFDDTVSPSGGSTLTYSYVQKKTPAKAAFRQLNHEYTAHEAEVVKKSADLKIFGGKFGMDRVLKKSEGRFNNLAFQMEEQVKSAVSLFHHTLINGDKSSRPEEFDGLDKMLVGTSTEFNKTTPLDISTMELLKKNADQLYEMLMDLIRATNADALLLNGSMLSKIQTLARVLGYKTETEEAFGKRVTKIDGVRLIDLKNHYDGNATAKPCVSDTITRSLSGSQTGLTDIYAVHFGINDGFHGATITGDSIISQYIPDFSKAGAVKEGEVEMVAATVLKNTKSAGVIRNIKIHA